MRQDAVFANGHYYHIFNRGVARMPTFSRASDYQHFILNSQYYRFEHPPMKLSKFLNQSVKRRDEIMRNMKEQFDQLVSVICFELMPNHWHFLLRQEKDHGISQMVSQISNSYTKHFNTKYERVGPLFQGPFKAVLIESEEQLLHVSRYIHLNALVGLVVPNFETLVKYPWSSLSDYLKGESDWLDMALVMAHFKSSSDYLGFLKDQVDFAKQLKRIKHLAIDLD